MKKIITCMITAAMITAVICLFGREYRHMRKERDRYRANVEVLSDSVHHYKTDAGDNAVRVGMLQMELSDYKKLRAEDLQTIKSLGIKQKELERVTTAQNQTIINLSGNVRDSIVYRDRNIIDTLRCITVCNQWYTLDGCADASGDFTGTFESRDSIILVETIRYKRFLGFLWRTKKIKDRHIDVMNKNPYTTISGMEHVIIEQ